MNGQYIIDQIAKYVVRTDFDRALALTSLNSVIREVYKGYTQYKFNTSREMIVPIDGFVYAPLLKDPEIVEYNLHLFTDNERYTLEKVISFDQVYSQFGSVSLKEPYTIGIPKYYQIVTNGIQLYPIPSQGYVSIFGEFFPPPLEDSATSTNTLAIEMTNGLIFLATAEYFDVLTELDRSQIYREKGRAEADNYFFMLRKQRSSNTHMMRRDPLGNLGWERGLKRVVPDTGVDTLDGGDWDDAHYSRAWA